MKRILYSLFLFSLLTKAFADTPNYHNLSNLNLANNLNYPVKVHFFNPNYLEVGEPCVNNIPTQDITVSPNKLTQVANQLSDINYLMGGSCAYHLFDKGYGPAQYQMDVTIQDGSANPPVISFTYFNTYQNVYDTNNPRQDIKITNGKSVCPTSRPLSVDCYPFQILPGSSLQTGNYKLTFAGITSQTNQQGETVYELALTVDYVTPPPVVHVTEVQNLTGQTLTAKYTATSGAYTPATPVNISADAVPTVGAFTYQVPAFSANKQALINYSYSATGITDSCDYSVDCSSGTSCNVVGVPTPESNKLFDCKLNNGSISGAQLRVDTLPTLAVNVKNSSQQTLAASYDPASHGRYYPENTPSANAMYFTYSPLQGNSVSAWAKYTTTNDVCTYNYSWDKDKKVWAISVVGDNKFITCANSTPVCTNDGKNCTVDFNVISSMSAINATYKNASINTQAVTAVYGGKGTYTPPQVVNPPSNFAYKLPEGIISEDNLIAYTASNGDSCSFGYNGCTLNIVNNDKNKSMLCSGTTSNSGSLCSVDLNISDLPQIKATYVNNSVRQDITAAYTGTGTYSDKLLNPPGNFIYTPNAAHLTDHGTVKYTATSTGDNCTFDYSWDTATNKCVVNVSNAESNKWIQCAFTQANAENNCTGNFEIKTRDGAPIMYQVVVKNHIFADLIPTSGNSNSVIEDGQSVVVSSDGVANTTTDYVYTLSNMQPLTIGCQFSVTWDANGKPTAIAAKTIGDGKQGMSQLNIDCTGPVQKSLLECATNPCLIDFGVTAPK